MPKSNPAPPVEVPLFTIRERGQINYRSQPNNQKKFFDLIMGGVNAGTLTEIATGGAIGGGKSKSVAAAIVGLATKYPGSRLYVCRRDLNDLRDTLYKDFCAMCPAELVRKPASGLRGRTQMAGDVMFHNGSEVMFRELKDISGKLSLEVNFIFIEQAEEIPYETYATLIGRLRPWPSMPKDSPFLMVITTNPHPGWIKERFVDHWQEGTLPPGRYFIPFPPSENADLLRQMPDYLDNMRSRLSADWVRRFVDGDWNTPVTGAVFVRFDPAIHRVETVALDIPPDVPRICVIDPHYAKPFACVWVALLPDGRRVAYDELKAAPLQTPREFLLDMLRRERAHRATTVRRLMDFSLAGMLHKVNDGKSLKTVMREMGIEWHPVTKAQKPEQIFRMSMLLVPGAGIPPRFVVGKNCPGLVKEFQGYAYQEGTFTPQVRKVNDDLLDCCFYANAELDKSMWIIGSQTPDQNYVREGSLGKRFEREVPMVWPDAELMRNTRKYEKTLRKRGKYANGGH